MAHRDRLGDPPGRREAAGDAGHRQGLPTLSGGSPARPEAACQGVGTGAPLARDAGHRRATRSWPKTLGSRLYGSLLRTFGISEPSRAGVGDDVAAGGERPQGGRGALRAHHGERLGAAVVEAVETGNNHG